MKITDFLINNVLYQSAINDELDYLKNGCSKNDKKKIKRLLNDIKKLGYSYKYFTDITNRENKNQKLFDLLLTYFGTFEDEYFNACIADKIGVKENNNKEITKILYNHYLQLDTEIRRVNSFFYDNAFNRIKSKKFIPIYLEILKDPEKAVELTLTIKILAKYKVEEAKCYFIKYLNSNLFFRSKRTKYGDLVYISIDCLSYYDDPDCKLLKIFDTFTNSEDDAMRRVIAKSKIRLMKNNHYNSLEN